MNAPTPQLLSTVKQAILTTFWEVDHDGDQMFDALAAAAIDAARSTLSAEAAALVQKWIDDLALGSVAELLVDNARLRIELAHLTDVRLDVTRALCGLVMLLAADNDRLRREAGA